MKLNVSKGQPLDFFADDKPASGVIVKVEKGGDRIHVTVRLNSPVNEGAKLAIAKGVNSGVATPFRTKQGVELTLWVMPGAIDHSTLP